MSYESPLHIEHFGKLRESLRIAFVYDNHTEDSSLDQSTARLIQELQARGHEISLIRTKTKAKKMFAIGNVFEQTLVKKSNLVSRALKMGSPAMTELTQLWSIRRPDIVFISADGALGWSAIKSARKLKIPSVSDIRSKFTSTNPLNHKTGAKLFRGAVMAYLRKFHNSTQRTLIHSNELKRQLSSLGFENLEVVPSSVDTELFNPRKRSELLRRSWGADASTTVLVYFSQGKKDNNLKWLIRYLNKFNTAIYSLKLVIISTTKDNTDHKYVENLFRVSQLENSELSEYLASADLMLAPGNFDISSVEIVESLASGIPIICQTTILNNKLLINAVNSVVVHSEKEEDFLITLSDVMKKPELIKHMGFNARQSAMDYEWNYLIDRIESIFSSVTTRNGHN